MIELITGTPGSFKTATAVLDVCLGVPGSFVEAQERCQSHGVTYEKGDKVPRHLFTNIKGLLLDHVLIDDESIQTWPEWAQPGDVIVFDEAQSLWRPRAVGSKVPPEIAALETHRHRGVDFCIVTQHPMLIDANVRRLVNRHRHMRRLPGGMFYEYEWDHQGQPGVYKTCVRSGVRRAPRAAFKLYSSATLHTKPKVKAPKSLLLVLLLALGGGGYFGPTLYARMNERFEAQVAAKAPAKSSEAKPTAGAAGAVAAVPAVPASSPEVVVEAPEVPTIAGCVQRGPECRCFGPDGGRVYVLPPVCLERLPQGAKAVDVSWVPEVPQGARSAAESEALDDMARFARSRLERPGVSVLGGAALRINGETVGVLR